MKKQIKLITRIFSCFNHLFQAYQLVVACIQQQTNFLKKNINIFAGFLSNVHDLFQVLHFLVGCQQRLISFVKRVVNVLVFFVYGFQCWLPLPLLLHWLLQLSNLLLFFLHAAKFGNRTSQFFQKTHFACCS